MAATMATTGARDSATPKTLFNYDSFTKKCENYVSANENTAKDIKCFLKALYGSVKEAETADGLSSGETLPELIVDDFDEEQIWQELELQNEARVELLVGSVSRLVAQKDRFLTDTGSLVKTGDKQNFQNGRDSLGESEEGGSDEDEEVEDEDEDDIELEDDEELQRISKLVNSFDDDSELSMPEDDDDDDDAGDDVDEDETENQDEIDEEDDILEQEENDKSDVEESGSKSAQKPSKKSKSKAGAEKKKHIEPSVVDDKFFKLSEMEAFLEKEEAEDEGDQSDGDSSEDSVDLFNDYPSDDDDDDDEDEGDDGGDNEASQSEKKGMHYSDFFDAPDGETPEEDTKPKTKGKKVGKDKKVKFNFGDSDGNESDKGSDSDASETSDLNIPSKSEVKSSYEIRQERLQAKIKKLEDEAVSAKPWQQKGEISGVMRPENALLEEHLEFDLTHRPAPVVTEETTQRLEDIIKQRIKDKTWDDVERKVKPVEAPSEFKKKLVLDQEKSKVSLAQIYEQEYLKQVAAAEPEEDKTDEVPKEHVEITKLVDSLFRKLDALSNFHYTPKQIAPEVKIVTNIPAISMEEVAPVATSEATLLAPEEVRAKPKGDVKSQAEKTETDRKRERRQKKLHQKHKAKDREQREAAVAKLRPGLGNKYSKEKAVKLVEKVAKDSNVSLIENTRGAPSLKSSKAFFNQLQDEVSTQMIEKSNLKKRKNESKTMSAKRVKL